MSERILHQQPMTQCKKEKKKINLFRFSEYKQA